MSVYYYKHLEKGLCGYCGSREHLPNLNYCEVCKEKQVEYTKKSREFFKSIGICPRCQKNQLYDGEQVCLICRAYNTENSIKYRAKHKEEYNEYQKEYSKKMHHDRLEKGVCTRCGKRRSSDGRKTCELCRTKMNETRRIRELRKNPNKLTKEERYDKGLCFWCDEPRLDGYKVCQKHYDMNIEKANSEKAKVGREKIRRDLNFIFCAKCGKRPPQKAVTQ